MGQLPRGVRGASKVLLAIGPVLGAGLLLASGFIQSLSQPCEGFIPMFCGDKGAVWGALGLLAGSVAAWGVVGLALAVPHVARPRSMAKLLALTAVGGFCALVAGLITWGATTTKSGGAGQLLIPTVLYFVMAALAVALHQLLRSAAVRDARQSNASQAP